MKTIPLFLTVLLAGCGATIMTTTSRSVIIHAPSVSIAQPSAQAECAKHNRFARFAQQPERFIYAFDCVE